MRRESGALEPLAPLELRSLRSLDLEAASHPDRAAHLSAASGVARRGDFVYVIGDDELALGVFRLTDSGPGTLRTVLPGTLPAGADARKDAKPDLEALTVLPPFAGHPFGSLLGLGSGSAPTRTRGFTWALGADGALRGEPETLDLEPVYALLGRHVEELNVEGACVMGDRLWLLQRGNDADGTNLVAELDLEEVMRSLREDRRLDAHELADLRGYDLGELDGVPLTFSDATPLGGERLVFTASAEAGSTTIEDGGIRGSVVGTMDTAGRVQRLRTIDRRYKVEGVHATIDTGVMDLLFVCDQDDPESSSPLLSAAMPLDAAFEEDQSAARSVTGPDRPEASSA